VLEVDVGGPVGRQIFGDSARGAGGVVQVIERAALAESCVEMGLARHASCDHPVCVQVDS
jgi:hypothetical protein